MAKSVSNNCTETKKKIFFLNRYVPCNSENTWIHINGRVLKIEVDTSDMLKGHRNAI